MNIAIVINTYQREDGLSPTLLKRALSSVFSQSHQNFKIFLIGDRYENHSEFLEICSQYDNEKFSFENLPFAFERDFYKDKKMIWSYAGAFASNYGVNKAINEGFEYICRLDHDDTWYSNHLEEINNLIELKNPLWICTRSEYVNGDILPRIISDEEIIPFLPIPEGIIHSSVCMNLKKIPIRYVDFYALSGKMGLPGDAYMWLRLRNYLMEIGETGYLINKITCKHVNEGYELKK